VIESRLGIVTVSFSGEGSRALFAHEGGGHRWQRIPPTEKRGRVQTSTVTVCVLPELTDVEVRLEEKDLEWQACRASGAGGQKVNKTDSAVQVTHRPSGLQIKVQTERSQHQNRATALALLRARLGEAEEARQTAARDSDRRAQLGTGERGDKVRTYRVRDDQVTDHRTGRKWRFGAWLRGQW
jgi:peptide chain release factor 1